MPQDHNDCQCGSHVHSILCLSTVYSSQARCALDQSNASHHVEEVTGGIRRGLTINIWKDKPLEQNFEDKGLSMDKYINKGLFDENGKPQGFNKDAV